MANKWTDWNVKKIQSGKEDKRRNEAAVGLSELSTNPEYTTNPF